MLDKLKSEMERNRIRRESNAFNSIRKLLDVLLSQFLYILFSLDFYGLKFRY